MLLLTRIEDRLRSQFLQHPAHPGELRRGHCEGQPLSPQFGFQAEIAPLLRAIVADDIAHNPGREVGHRGAFPTTILQLFPADHVRPPERIPWRAGGSGWSWGGTVANLGRPVWAIVRTQQNPSELHKSPLDARIHPPVER